MKIDPIQDCVLVLPDRHASETRGGLVIPETVHRSVVTGTILAKGPGILLKAGKKIAELDIAVGDRILFQKHMGTEVQSAGQKVLVLRYKFILAVIPKDVSVEWVDPPLPTTDQTEQVTQTA